MEVDWRDKDIAANFDSLKRQLKGWEKIKGTANSASGWFLAGSDFGEANMAGMDLRNSDFRGVYLVGTDMEGARLGESKFEGAHMRDANLRGADLRWSDLTDADLRGTYLYYGDMRDLPLKPTGTFDVWIAQNERDGFGFGSTGVEQILRERALADERNAAFFPRRFFVRDYSDARSDAKPIQGASSSPLYRFYKRHDRRRTRNPERRKESMGRRRSNSF